MHLNVQGHDAFCYTGGKSFDTDLPTAVFIHGAQNDHSVWALQSRYFAHHGFGVLAVDLPGHGRSTGAPLHTIEAMSAWLLAALDTAGVRQAILIGHSMGSLIALETAFQSPSHVDKLAMVGTAYPMKVSQALLDAAKSDVQRAIEMVDIWSLSSIAPKPSFPGPGFHVSGGNRRLMQRIAKQTLEPVFHMDFFACNAYSNGEIAARSVLCPTLLLLGKRDIMTPPRQTSALAKAMPHARVVQVENCGHLLMAEQPDAVLDTLFCFAAQQSETT